MRSTKAAYVTGAEACQNPPEKRYATKNDTDIIPLCQPHLLEDPLTKIARNRWGGRPPASFA